MALKGVAGKIAVVDLGSGEVRIETVPEEVYEKYLGGYGLGAYYVYRNQPAGADPLGPEALFGLAAGLLTGTDAITGNRFVAVGKSPKTGGWGDANCGGDFGPALKRAGLDAVFVRGISETPVYLRVQGGEVFLHEAGELWGGTCGETERLLKERHGRSARSAVIGPAGERVSALACIINDRGRAAGRSGLGMIMGAKRLKGVVAVPGQSVQVARSQELKELRKRLLAEYFTTGNPLYDFFHGLGTPGALAPNVEKGDCPVRNWAGLPSDFPDSGKISGPAMEELKVRPYGCWKCPVACGAHVRVESGPYAGEGHRPEYETLGAFGSMCLNDNLESICRLNNICNDYGMDTISTGCTVAFAMECFEHGLVSESDLGYPLHWGDHEAIVRMTLQMARGEGFAAEVFGHGMRGAVDKLGDAAEAFATDAGGEELPMHDPRCFPGLGISYVADATPGRHTQPGAWNLESGSMAGKYGLEMIKDKYDFGGKGPGHKLVSNFGHVMNAAGLCLFATFIAPDRAVSDYLTLVTGREFDLDKIQEIGERLAALRMAFNLREGVLNARDYSLPGRVLGKPPLAGGPVGGVSVDNAAQLESYWRSMGWDPETGGPGREALRRLGLDFALDALGTGT